MPGRGIWTYYACKEKSCEGKLFRNRQGVRPLCPNCSGSNTVAVPKGVDVRKILELQHHMKENAR